MNKFKLKPVVALMLATAAVPQVFAAETDNADNDDNRVMITGSRIARAEVSTSSPVSVITKSQLTDLGLTDISSALRRLPALTGATANNQRSDGANNIQTATLRGIEATNTLVLVNGRRIVGSDENGLIDLSSIPFEAVSEIQVLKDGASAIYGSDAIAGVVNIITRQNYDGFEFNAHYGVSSEGDGQERKVGFVLGTSGDRGSLMIAASTSNNSGWESRDRYMTQDANQEYLGGSNGRSSTAPNAKLSGFGLADGNWTVLDAANPSAVVPFADSMKYNYREATSGANNNATTSVFMTADYEISSAVSFFTELSFHDGTVRGAQAPPGTDTGWYSGNIDTPNAFKRYPTPGFDDDGNPITIQYGVGANQKYNPFGLPGNVARRFSEYGPRIYDTSNTISRYTLGLEGAFGDDYDWQLVYSTQSAKLVSEGGPQPSIIMIERALSNECETAADPTCVALNVFGPEGTITQGMLDFINTTAPVTTNKNDLMFIQASVSGPVMQMPAGDMMFAAGVEYREDQLSLTVDQAQRTATFDVSWGGSSTPVVSPVRKVKEMYAEFSIPVIENLDFEAAVRYTEYSDINKDTVNPKFGVVYQPVDMLKLRASHSTGFRAPTMAEMYQGRTSTINTSIYDPCTNDNAPPYSSSVPGCQNINPAVANNTIQSNDIIGGGNPDLKPEEAENTTLGLVLEPMEGLSFTLDYFSIKQTDVVFASSDYVVDQNIAGNPEYANDVIRSNNGTGYIQTIFSPANNVAARNVAGFDLNANYLLETSFGEWRFNLDATFMDKFEVQDTSDEPFRDVSGTYDNAFGSLPETKINMQVDWKMDDFRVTYDNNYNSKIVASPTDTMDSTLFHNIQAGYFIEDINTDVHFGIQNLLDKEPPFLKNGGNGTDQDLYSFRGRFFYVGATVTF